LRKFLAILFILALSCSLSAQEVSTGNIFGKIVDEQGTPLPGVNVTLTGLRTGTMTAVTSGQGMFRFLSLAPANDYTVKAELGGFKTVTRGNIIIVAGSNVSLTLTMEVGALEEEVTVVAPTPVVDAKKTSVGINVTQEMLQSLPSARDPWDILQMVPAVVVNKDNVGGIDGGQQAGSMGRGAPGNQNSYTLAGMEVTANVSVGASGPYYDFGVFEEMNVTVGGNDVTMQTSGSRINMVAKRAGNNISLGGRFYLIDEWFQGDNLTDELIAEGLSGVDRFREMKDYGFNFGIPIVRDKAWIWGSWGVQNIETFSLGSRRDDTLLSTLSSTINLQLVPENRLEVFLYANRKQKFGRDPTPAIPDGLIQRPSYHFGWPAVKIQDEHMFGDNLFITAKYAFYNIPWELVPVMDPEWDDIATYDFRDQRWYNSYQKYFVTSPSTRLTFNANLFNDEFLGVSHDLLVGAEYSTRMKGENGTVQPGNFIVRQNYIAPTVDFDGDGNPDVPASSNFKRFELERKNTRVRGSEAFTAYFRDTITVGRLTLLLGFRFDRQTAAYQAHTLTAVEPESPQWKKLVNSQTTQLLDNLLPGFQMPGREGIAADGSTYAWVDYSPRLGITYDVFGDSRTIAKLAFGQYGSYMGIGEANRWISGGGSGWIDFWWQDNGDGMLDYTELYWHTIANYSPYRAFDDAGNFIGNWADAAGQFWGSYDYTNPQLAIDPYQSIDSDAQGMRTTEVMVSLERELLPDFAVQVNGTYRKFNNYRWTLKYFPDTGVFDNQGWYISAGTPPAEIPGIGDTKEAKNNEYYYLSTEGSAYSPYTRVRKQPDYYVDYWGLDFIFNKRLSNKWMLNGSFTIHTMGEHFGDQGFLNPNNVWANEGAPTTDRWSPWLLKLSGLYQLPYDINIGFTYNGRQGWIIREYFRLVDYTIPNPRSQSHDLDMTKFGTEALPTVHRLNLRLEKMFRVAETGRMYMMADLFNVFNSAANVRRQARFHGTYYVYDDSSLNRFVPNINNYKLLEVINPRVARFGIRFQF